MNKENKEIIDSSFEKHKPVIEILEIILSNPEVSELNEELDYVRKVYKVKEADIKLAKRNIKCHDEYNRTINNVNDYVRAFCKKYDVTPMLNETIQGTDPITFGDITYEIKDLIENDDPMYLSMRKRIKERNFHYYIDTMLINSKDFGFNFNKQEIETIFGRYVEDHLANKVIMLADEVSYSVPGSRNVRNENLWDKLYENAFNHQGNANKELVIAVLKNFIHSVKRKLLGMKPDYCIMPIILGNQGGGKSYFMETFISVFEGFHTDVSLSELGDERTLNVFKNYVVTIDEMVRADKAEWAAIKNAITTSQISRRILGTNKQATITNNASFIATANGSYEQYILDDTGNRRFFPIYFTNKNDQNVYNARDYCYKYILEFWKSVDEKAPSPLKEFDELLKNVLEEHRSKSDIEQWIEENNFKDQVVSNNNSLQLEKAFSSFCDWAAINEKKTPKANSRKIFNSEFKRLCNSETIPFETTNKSNRYYIKYTGEETNIIKLNTPVKERLNNILKRSN